MRSVFVNRATPDLNIFLETSCFYCMYFISDMVQISSVMSLHIYLYQNRSRWNETFIITMAERSEFSKEVDDESKKWIRKYADDIRRIRNIKHKGKQELVMINRFNTVINKIKECLIIDFEERFKSSFVYEWIDLFDYKTVEPMRFIPYDPVYKPTEEDEIIKLFCEEFIDDNCKKEFIMLLPNIAVHKKGYSVSNENDAKMDNPDFYSFTLYQIALLPSINKETMPIIRAELLRKAQPFVCMLQEFKSAMQAEVYDDKVKELTCGFYKKIEPEAAIFQHQIEQQIYFRQAMYSGVSFVNYKLNVCVCSVKTVIDYYCEVGVMLPFVGEALKKNISLQRDINSCDVFLYLTEVPAINNPV